MKDSRLFLQAAVKIYGRDIPGFLFSQNLFPAGENP